MEETLLNNLLAVYDHLEHKRQKLKKEYEDVEQVLTGVRREISALKATQALLFPESERPERKKYQNISMRWAILWHLSESVGPLQTPTVADGLREGGVSERPNFNSIVSAILSQMSQKSEVERVEGGYRLTNSGQQTWDGIRRSEKFLNRHTVPASDAE
ncbi:MAG TPA: hypothetical protein VN151_07710 [Terracidiphilus sp.]|nr:hypothetical protein [Terracidiphilus sp.]